MEGPGHAVEEVRAIARACSVAPGTVHEYVHRATKAGLAWPLPVEMDDGGLEARLFAASAPAPGPRPHPDLVYLHQELRRP